MPDGDDGSPLVAATIRYVHTPCYVEYGFVRRDSGGRDLYFHRSVVEGRRRGPRAGQAHPRRRRARCRAQQAARFRG